MATNNAQGSSIKNAAIEAFGDRTPKLIAELEKVMGAYKLSGGDIK